MEYTLKQLTISLWFLALTVPLAHANDLPLPFNATLKRVIDGDSVNVVTGNGEVTEIRLWGIDAPEFGAPWSRKSTAGLKRVLQDRELLITPVTFDRYNRLVSEVFVGDVNSGLRLVNDGLAWVYRRYNNRADYIQAQQNARARSAGLWSDPVASATPPWEWRKLNSRPNSGSTGCEVSEATVVGNRRSMIFHHRGCPDFVKVSCGNRVEFDSPQEAQANGYRAARNCKARR